MKNLMLAVVLAVGTAAVAQEIGSEIKQGPTTTTSPTTTGTYDNPYATPPPPPSATGAPMAQPSAPQVPTTMSAGKGAFGIRAGLGSLGVSLAVGTGAAAATSAPTVGLSYWANDQLSLLFDVGFGLVIANNALWALSFGLGIDFHGRTTTSALRPLFNFGVNFGLASVGSNVGVGLTINLGGGAEYFLSPNFSFRGTVGVTVPMSFSNNVVFGIFTLTPGVGVAYYF